MYRVIYKGYSGDYHMSDEMTLDVARKFKDDCLKIELFKRECSYYTDCRIN